MAVLSDIAGAEDHYGDMGRMHILGKMAETLGTSRADSITWVFPEHHGAIRRWGRSPAVDQFHHQGARIAQFLHAEDLRDIGVVE